eukprot:31499-Pelagococcus_subviridis.AAC.8
MDDAPVRVVRIRARRRGPSRRRTKRNFRSHFARSERSVRANLVTAPRSVEPSFWTDESANLIGLSAQERDSSACGGTSHRAATLRSRKLGKMQAVTMNTTLGLGLGLRARARVSAKAKATTLYGAPVVGDSVKLSVRKTAKPSVVVRAAAEPLIEAPFKGIKDDIAGRTPVYLDDFKQGLNGKALVRPIALVPLR